MTVNRDKKQDNEKPVKEERDRWAPNGVFVHYGMGYAITKTLRTYCIGPVDSHGKPIKNDNDNPIPENATDDTPPNNDDSPPDAINDVTKIVDKGIIPPRDMPTVKNGIMLQGKKRGRPRKNGEEPVSRMTEYRRRKRGEKQGVLL